MSTNLHINPKLFLLPSSTPKLRMIACSRSLNNLLEILELGRLNLEQREFVKRVAQFILNCANSYECQSDNEFAEKIVKTTVNGVLNTFIIDEMHSLLEKRVGDRYYG
ncbi:MAG: hypothetical protein M3P33_04210, partial [bacterium]|nr:hypothetical protein [bacterium]